MTGAAVKPGLLTSGSQPHPPPGQKPGHPVILTGIPTCPLGCGEIATCPLGCSEIATRRDDSRRQGI
eukprot:302850-Chlamydomonas_euryale.AAC.1